MSWREKIITIIVFCVLVGSLSFYFYVNKWDHYSSYIAVPIDGEPDVIQFHWYNKLYEFQFEVAHDFHPILIVLENRKYVSTVLNLDKVKSWDDGNILIKIKEVSSFGKWIGEVAISDDGKYIGIGDNCLLQLAFIARYDLYVR